MDAHDAVSFDQACPPPADDPCPLRVGNGDSFEPSSQTDFCQSSDSDVSKASDSCMLCVGEEASFDSTAFEQGSAVLDQSPAEPAPQLKPALSIDDGFQFTSDQIACPIVIDVYCGSARVTACLREIGPKESFGVDHKTGKAIAAARNLDLTVTADQTVVIKWLH